MAGQDNRIICREFVPGDEFSLAALIKEVFRQFVAQDLCPDDAAVFLESQTPKFIYFRFLYGNRFIIIAQDEDAAKYRSKCGIAGVIEVERPCHISLLFVRKDRQGRGIAKKLLAEALKRCRRANPSLAYMTLNSMPYAWRIYERMGFQKAGRAFGSPVTNSIPMVMHLR